MVTVPRIAAVSCLSTIPFIYGVQQAGNLRAELSLSDPSETVRRFSAREADIALLPAAAVPSLPDALPVTEYCVGGLPAAAHALAESSDPLVCAWKPWGRLPFAFAVWVARADVDPAWIEELQRALTFGLEHGYEALLCSAGDAEPRKAYEALMLFDYIFDNQKRQALQKFWDSGMKVSPRANPG